jgi:predicted DNA binding CopG/RHH family protein
MPKFDESKMRVIANHVLEDPEISEMVTRVEAEADAQILAGVVTLRWGKKQINTVKRAASYMGVPYQTYLKQVVFRQALSDIAEAEAVLGKRPKQAEAPAAPKRSRTRLPH